MLVGGRLGISSTSGKLARYPRMRLALFHRIEHSGAMNSADSLSPGASTPAPQTLAQHKRVYARLGRAMGEGWAEGPLFGRLASPPSPRRAKMRGGPLPQGERAMEHAARESPYSPSGST